MVKYIHIQLLEFKNGQITTFKYAISLLEMNLCMERHLNGRCALLASVDNVDFRNIMTGKFFFVAQLF